MKGRTVRLFLVDGTPTGVLTAEVMNWTGRILVAPRSSLAEALQREEADRTGIYFLVGDDPTQPSKSRVYIGEGDSVAGRIRSHIRDETKDFWTRACIVTSKDMNLTKAHVRYLESRFVELVKSADRSNLANGNAPAPKMLPESDVADMEFFISQVQVVLPTLGFEFLRPKAAPPAVPSEIGGHAEAAVPSLELYLESSKYGFEAKGVEVGGEIIVLAGSRAEGADRFTTNSYAALRQQLIDEGRLVPSAEPGFLEFTDDVPFQSPSAAAAVIKNRNTNGRTSWKVRSTGETLKDWQDSQIVGDVLR